MANSQSYVAVTPEKGKIDIHWGFNIFMKKNTNGKFICFIPSFDIIFSTKNENEIDNKAIALTKMFFDNFIIYKKNAVKAISEELHSLGFKADADAYIRMQYAKNKPSKAKFKMDNSKIPVSFEGAYSKNHESKMELELV